MLHVQNFLTSRAERYKVEGELTHCASRENRRANKEVSLFHVFQSETLNNLWMHSREH